MLQLNQIQIKFDETVIENGTLIIPRGKLVALTGPSGSGKTTLLYCIGLISSNQNYEYRFDGKEIDLTSDSEKGEVRKAKIGYIFQENNLNGNLTVFENVRMSASLAGADIGMAKIKDLLLQVGLTEIENQYPSALSGGEQQRAAIACALAKEPELIIADEPTSAMDETNTNIVLELLQEIADQGKMVVIATHAPEVVDHCAVVYDIQEKKPVLVKGAEFVELHTEKENKAEKKWRLKWPFFFRYQIKSGRKGQILKNITTVICALSIAFTALSTGYISDFAEQQSRNFQAVSERELIVVNQYDPKYPTVSAFQEETPSLSESEIEQLQQIEGAETFGPVVFFRNRTELWEEDLEIYSSAVPETGMFNSYIEYQNDYGKTGKVGFCATEYYNTETGENLYDAGEDIISGGYYIASYFTYESMDLKCKWIDQSVEPNQGIYISSALFDSMGLEKKDLYNMKLTIDAAIPIKRMISVATATPDEGDSYCFDMANDWCVKKQITFPIRGVMDSFAVNSPICAPFDIMMNYIEENTVDALPDSFHVVIPDADTWFNDIYEWRPWAYYLMAEDISKIEQIKQSVALINENFTVLHEYQDYEALMESVDNSQRVVLFTSLAILSVVLFLMAIIYINIIDKRKFEFAMLKANGLTKQEIRKLVWSEMGIQAIVTFLVSLLLAWILVMVLPYFVGGFKFDWLTVIWIAVISLVSIILPSLIALIFSNKYEPDKIMRN